MDILTCYCLGLNGTHLVVSDMSHFSNTYGQILFKLIRQEYWQKEVTSVKGN